MSKNCSGIVLFMAILIVQMVVVKSQQSVNPIEPTPTEQDQPVSLTTHVVKVGYMDYGFSRNNFTASKGNVLFWEWEGDLEHSVVESSLEMPCVKKEGGFDLGAHVAPYNSSMAVDADRAIVFFSDVAEDCKNGMYGGINLPEGYTWPKELVAPPKQIVTTPLNPPEPTGSMTTMGVNPTDTGSMTTMGASGASSSGDANAKPTQETSKSNSSTSTSNSTKPGYNMIIGTLVLISFYFYYRN